MIFLFKNIVVKYATEYLVSNLAGQFYGNLLIKKAHETNFIIEFAIKVIAIVKSQMILFAKCDGAIISSKKINRADGWENGVFCEISL